MSLDVLGRLSGGGLSLKRTCLSMLKHESLASDSEQLAAPQVLAEREGFEPPIALRLCLISSQVHSTGLCHLSACLQPFRGRSRPHFSDPGCFHMNLYRKLL